MRIRGVSKAFGTPERAAAELSAPCDVRMHRTGSGEQTITVTVPREPVLAGVDPYHRLDCEDPNDDDNIEDVDAESGARSSRLTR